MSPRRPWGDHLPDPHIWRTLGYRRLERERGQAAVEWDAGDEHTFEFNGRRVVHGGMVATVLDTAMGGACYMLLDQDEEFLTADLRVEFFRSARPGTLLAEARVVHRSRRLVFCEAELKDAEGTVLAGARCTQVVLANPQAA